MVMVDGLGKWRTGWAIHSITHPISHQLLAISHVSALPQIDHESGAPIQASRFLAAVVVLRPLLTVAHRPQAVGGDTTAHQVVLHGVRATVAEGEVVFGRADAAGVTFDLD